MFFLLSNQDNQHTDLCESCQDVGDDEGRGGGGVAGLEVGDGESEEEVAGDC